MKYDLIVRYKNQEITFHNLELDDEDTLDETYPEGVQGNNDKILEDFEFRYEAEVRRL